MYELLNKLARTNSNPEKVTILQKYDSQGLREILHYAYNPFYIYGLKEASVGVAQHGAMENRYDLTEDEKRCLNLILKRDITGFSAIDLVQATARKHGSLITAIVLKDLRAGISATTINKAFPGLIHTFKVQLAKEVPFNKLRYPVYSEIKYDGVRIVALVTGSRDVVLKTRNGKLVVLPKLQAELGQLIPGMYDGELIQEISGTRTKVSGLVNSAMKGGNVSERGLQYILFDHLSLCDFSRRKSQIPMNKRRTQLAVNLAKVDGPLKMVAMSDGSIIHNSEQAEEAFKVTLSQGYEGLILKDLNGLYEFKRSKAWAKAKAIKEADLECIAIEHGTGKYDCELGAIVCKNVVEGKQVTVRVGTGFSDEQRYRYADAPSDIVGSTVAVKYNEVIPGFVEGTWTLFLPRFVEVRIDK